MPKNSTFHRDRRAESKIGERELVDLLSSSKRRPETPAADFRRIRAAARLEWQAVVEARTRRRRPFRLLVPATAAAVVLLGVWIWGSRQGAPGAPPVAVVELLTGNAWLEEPPGTPRESGSSLKVGGSLPRGVELLTGNAPDAAVNVASIRLAGGQSVRLGSGTQVALTGPSRLQLHAGLLYVDSPGPESEAGELKIDTPLGTVVDIGTQFLLALADGTKETLTVRVRSGAVEVRRQQEAHAAGPGEELRLLADGSVDRGACATAGDEWDWTLSAAPAFDIDGASLTEFLYWVVRETGWHLRYADSIPVGEAADIQLHGTIEGLRPDEAVAPVLAGAGLSYRLQDDELTVARPQRDGDGL